jgi:hypothetical protein
VVNDGTEKLCALAQGTIARLPDEPASHPRLPALRLARCRVAQPARTLCRPLARDLRRGARHLRAHRAREVRAVQPHGRHAGAAFRRREGHPAAGHARRAQGLRRIGNDERRAGLRHRRHAAALHAVGRGQQLLRDGLGEHRLQHAHQRQRQPADGARHRDAERGVREERVLGPLGRHHVPVGAAGRLVAERRGHARGARWRRLPGRPARPALPPHRQQDVDLVGRPRADREHRAHRARQDPRRERQAGAGHARHLAVHRAQAHGRHARANSPASATTWRWRA